jgi:hypothetical protein
MISGRSISGRRVPLSRERSDSVGLGCFSGRSNGSFSNAARSELICGSCASPGAPEAAIDSRAGLLLSKLRGPGGCTLSRGNRPSRSLRPCSPLPRCPGSGRLGQSFSVERPTSREVISAGRRSALEKSLGRSGRGESSRFGSRGSRASLTSRGSLFSLGSLISRGSLCCSLASLASLGSLGSRVGSRISRCSLRSLGPRGSRGSRASRPPS